MSTERTVEVINNMANMLEDYAKILRREATELKESGDWSICGEVVQTIASMNGSLRLDLLVNRPIRELEKQAGNLTYRLDAMRSPT